MGEKSQREVASLCKPTTAKQSHMPLRNSKLTHLLECICHTECIRRHISFAYMGLKRFGAVEATPERGFYTSHPASTFKQ